MKIGIFLDIDGVCTLEPANLQYAKLLGAKKQELRLEADFSSGKLSTEEFGDKLVRLFRSNGFSKDWARQNFEKIKFKSNYSRLLSLFPEKDIYLVSSSPNYFIEPLAKKFKIPLDHTLSSRYEFDTDGLIIRSANPVGATTKKNFVQKYRAQYDVTVGIGDVPAQDSAFMDLCDFSIVMAHDTKDHLKVESAIDPINDFLTSLKRVIKPFEEAEIDKSKLASAIDGSLRLLGKSRASKYERNVFIMTPFREDARYQKVIQTIKQKLAERGFYGWLASDKKLVPELWYNVQAFMLACKYGIAIFAREVKRKGSKAPTSEFNPNVSTELGFMLSRGKEVLILKDKPLKRLPSDVMGSLYKEFDLNQPKQSVEKWVKEWIEDILGRET